jgi:hypothetical protein
MMSLMVHALTATGFAPVAGAASAFHIVAPVKASDAATANRTANFLIQATLLD